jgi:ABC-type transporter Mla MlaB component
MKPPRSIAPPAIVSHNLPPQQAAALLYAHGRSAEATDLLQQTLQTGGSPGIEVWAMLFDLYRAEGEWQGFEALTSRFQQAFGRAAPQWTSDEEVAGLPPELRPGGSAYFELSGVLDARLAPDLAALRGRANQHTTLHLDLSKLTAIEAEGCQQLSRALRQLTASHSGVLLTGTRRLTRLLRDAAEGNGSTSGYWQLLLDIFQLLGLRADFESTALAFALASGATQPQWQTVLMPVVPQQEKEEKRDEPRYQAGPELIQLHGILAGTADPQLARLREIAQDRKYVNINMAGVIRVDFRCASALTTLANELAGTGKTVRLIRPNALIAALLSTFDLSPQVHVNRADIG